MCMESISILFFSGYAKRPVSKTTSRIFFFFWFLFLLNLTTIKIIIIIIITIIIKNNYEEHRMKSVFSIKQLNDLTSHVYLTHFINTALGLGHYMDLVISYGFHHFVIKSQKTSSMFSAMGKQCFRRPSPEEM